MKAGVWKLFVYHALSQHSLRYLGVVVPHLGYLTDQKEARAHNQAAQSRTQA